MSPNASPNQRGVFACPPADRPSAIVNDQTSGRRRAFLQAAFRAPPCAHVWGRRPPHKQTPIPASLPLRRTRCPCAVSRRGFYPKAAMTALDYALRLIKKWEGCRLTAYPDPATGGDPWTIGWGSTGKGIGPGVQWTLEQADDRLARDVGRFMAGVRGLLKVDPEPNELGAMTSLAYNIGLGNFRSSTLLRKFNAGDKAGAAAEFGKWNRAAGKVMKGLTNRRADERQVFTA